ncbi:MAG: DUF1553 domain-containing protein, partial [Planctomycetota bacterium]
MAKLATGKNKLIDEPDGFQAVQLTGDDEAHVAAGEFRRYQPFTISSRIWIPEDPKILDRSVIYHRSRAWTDSASRGYQLLIKKGKLSASLIHFWPGNAISVETIQPIKTEAWVDVAFVYDGSSQADGIQIYIDGQPVELKIIRDNLEKKIVGTGTDKIKIGARFRDIGFKNGKLADFRVFRRALTSLEVDSLTQKSTDSQVAIVPKRSTDDQEKLFELFLSRNEKYKNSLQEIEEARKQLGDLIDGTSEIMVMKEMENLRPAFILDRGAYDAPSTPVSPNTPAVFPPLPEGGQQNRLGLARWLISGQNPLTARVAVNHYWQLCFGEGLVRTPEDFGSQGQPPTHPELLDWLAVEFVENGWDVKRLLKQILMSNTYQQSTFVPPELLKKDPDNFFLARSPSYRLTAEMIRDNTLFTSGLLVEKRGGAPVKPYELEQSFKPAKPDAGQGVYRRSLYTFWQRNGPAPVMLTLDAAKRDVCQVKRERTSSP